MIWRLTIDTDRFHPMRTVWVVRVVGKNDYRLNYIVAMHRSEKRAQDRMVRYCSQQELPWIVQPHDRTPGLVLEQWEVHR
jgi:hypothetical protein